MLRYLEDSEYTEFDVFISHASEDKEDFVSPLAEALADRGLRVWYDEFELRIGDSLRQKIDDGLALSRVSLLRDYVRLNAKGKCPPRNLLCYQTTIWSTSVEMAT